MFNVDIHVPSVDECCLTAAVGSSALQVALKDYQVGFNAHQVSFNVYDFSLFSSKYCVPYLKKGNNPHILNISPPLNMNPRWFKDHVGEYAYTPYK